MTEIPISRLIQALLNKGFERVETHHIMLWFVVKGTRTPIHTWVSHGQRKADDWLIGRIAKEIHLSKRELLRLVECEISREEYIRLLEQRGRLRPLS